MYDYCREGMQIMPTQSHNPMATLPEQMHNPMATMPAQNMYNPMATMPMQNMPMGTMPMQNMYPTVAGATEEELENLYPETYNVIAPAIEDTCDKWMGKFGEKCPSNAEVDSMVEDIYKKVEPAVEAAVKKSPVAEERQFFGGGRRVLRDFIGALLISSLIRRRRRPFFGYPGGFYGGFPFY